MSPLSISVNESVVAPVAGSGVSELKITTPKLTPSALSAVFRIVVLVLKLRWFLIKFLPITSSGVGKYSPRGWPYRKSRVVVNELPS